MYIIIMAKTFILFIFCDLGEKSNLFLKFGHILNTGSELRFSVLNPNNNIYYL